MASNPKRYWFRARDYGWGWVPCSTEGWLALAVFIAADVILWVVISVAFAESGAAMVTGVLLTFALVVPLIAVCYAKGETPSWHWGRRAR